VRKGGGEGGVGGGGGGVGMGGGGGRVKGARGLSGTGRKLRRNQVSTVPQETSVSNAHHAVHRC